MELLFIQSKVTQISDEVKLKLIKANPFKPSTFYYLKVRGVYQPHLFNKPISIDKLPSSTNLPSTLKKASEPEQAENIDSDTTSKLMQYFGDKYKSGKNPRLQKYNSEKWNTA